jgi:hypothetical protein
MLPGYCIHAAHRLGYVSEQLRDELEKDIKASAHRWPVSCVPQRQT